MTSVTDKPAPGRYELARDVANPQPDGRSPQDWTRARVWPRGTRIQILAPDGHKPWMQFLSAPAGAMDRCHRAAGIPADLGSPQWDALLPCLAAVEPTHEDLLVDRLGTTGCYFEVLLALLQSGEVSHAQVDAAMGRVLLLRGVAGPAAERRGVARAG